MEKIELYNLIQDHLLSLKDEGTVDSALWSPDQDTVFKAKLKLFDNCSRDEIVTELEGLQNRIVEWNGQVKYDLSDRELEFEVLLLEQL